MNLIIKIAIDFSKTPGARIETEGLYSAVDFREKILYPKFVEAVEKQVKLIIDLDGTSGIGTSFFEESFGGLIREDGLSYDNIVKSMTLISNDDPDYIDEINSYLQDAYEKSKTK